MLNKRSIILGSTKDTFGREYIAVKKNSNLIVKIKAGEEDLYNIRSDTSRASLITNFKSYVDNLTRDYQQFDYPVHVFVSNFVYAYNVKEVVLNNYNNFIKNNIMLAYYLEVMDVIQDDEVCRFKSIND